MSYLRNARAGRGRAMGCCGMGDVAATSPVAALAAQVNRFGPSAPAAYRFTQRALPPVLDTALALTALTIYLRRSTDAYAQIPDQGTLSAINAANAGFADPVTFVGGHLDEVIPVIRDFADSLGLPGAAGDGGGGGGGGGMSTDALLLAGGILVGWFLLEKR